MTTVSVSLSDDEKIVEFVPFGAGSRNSEFTHDGNIFWPLQIDCKYIMDLSE